jgi:hypothetical protein
MTKIYFGFRHGTTQHGAKLVTDAFFTRGEAAEALLEYKKTSKRLTGLYETWKNDPSVGARSAAGRKWKDLDKCFSIWERDLPGVTRTVSIEAA